MQTVEIKKHFRTVYSSEPVGWLRIGAIHSYILSHMFSIFNHWTNLFYKKSIKRIRSNKSD
nr:MAG TPA: hypothetical protein [Caudoviricetes sp.]